MTQESKGVMSALRTKLAGKDFSFLAYFAARIISGLAGVVMLRFLVTLLTKDEYSLWGYYRTIGRMLVPVLTLSLPAAMMRMYFDHDKGDIVRQRTLITTIFWLCFGSGALMGMAGLGFYFMGGETSAFASFFCFVAPAGIFISFFDYLTRLRNNYLLYTANRVVESGGFALLLWLSIAFADERIALATQLAGPEPSTLMWIILLYATAIWTMLLGNFLFYLRAGYVAPFSGVLDRQRVRALFAFSAPLTGTYFLGWALNSSDIYLLRKLSTLSQTGDYIFAVGIASFVGMITSAALNDWPRFYYGAMRDAAAEQEAAGTRDFSQRDRAISDRICLFLLFHLSAMVIIRLIANFAYELLNAGEYKAGIRYIDFLILGNFFFLAGNIAAVGIGYAKKTHLTLVTFAVPGVLNFGLNLWLIPIYGAEAAAFTTLAAFVVFALASFAVGRQFYRITGMGRISALLALGAALALMPLSW